ncbi:glycosyltransferase, partial [bacterium]|nr:glycosyltransferase [bacterium]
ICKLLQKEDKRIKIIKNQNGIGGAGNNRNIGIDASTKEYIGFMDSDDYIEPDYYEKLYDSCKMFNSDIALADVIEIDYEQNKIIKTHKYNLQFEYSIKKMFSIIKTGSVWDKLYRAEVIKSNNIKFLENVLYEDVPFLLEVFCNSNKMVTVPNTNYFWIRNNWSVTRNQNYNAIRSRDAYTVAKYMVNYLKNKKIAKEDADFVAYWILSHFGLLALRDDIYKDRLLSIFKGFDISINREMFNVK